MGQAGTTYGIGLLGGNGGLGSQQANSAAMLILAGAGPGAWDKGIVFSNGSIGFSIPGVGQAALALPTSYAITFYSPGADGPSSPVAAYIRSDTTTAPGPDPAALVFTGTGGYLQAAAGTAEMAWTNNLVQIRNLAVTGASHFYGGVTFDSPIYGTLTATSLQVDGTSHFTGATIFDQPIIAPSGTSVFGNLTTNVNLAVNGNTNVNGTLGVTGSTQLSGRLVVGHGINVPNGNLVAAADNTAALAAGVGAGDVYINITNAGALTVAHP